MDQTLEPKPTFEPKFDLSHILESVLIPVPFILEPKSTTPLSHIPFLDLTVDYYDSEMIFQDWSYNQNNFHFRILHDPNQIGDSKNVNKKEVKGEFFETPHYLD